MSQPPLILGVDGGGTKTVAWLAPLDDAANTVVLGRGAAGPGNPRAVGFETAQANILVAIEAAFADARLARCTVEAACFGLAGAGRGIEQQRISAWAQQQAVAGVVRVVGDAEPILAAAASDVRGVALICGTGSLAWGRNAAGQVARAGGWGYLLGDEGSGYQIARAALIAALQAFDGRGRPTVLLDRLLPALGVAAPEELVEIVYSPHTSRERVAGLASVVFDAAAEDAVALTIIESAAGELAEMVAAVCRRLQLPDGEYALALAGSVILNRPRLREHLQTRLNAIGWSTGAIWLVPEPVRGAVALARAAARDAGSSA
jgi:N-acetylglucosamine kinase-like BadF-type ATPase